MSVIRGSNAHFLRMLHNRVQESKAILAKYPNEIIPQRENMIIFLNGFTGASDEYILQHKDKILRSVMAIAEILHLVNSEVLNRQHAIYLIIARINDLLREISKLNVVQPQYVQNSTKYLNRIKFQTDDYIHNNIDKIEKNISKIEKKITDFENDEMLTSSTNAALNALAI